MKLTSRAAVYNTVKFKSANRMPYDLPEAYGSDFFRTINDIYPDWRPKEGVDLWGCVWESFGKSDLGEVKGFPLKSRSDMEKLTIPISGMTGHGSSLPCPGKWC